MVSRVDVDGVSVPTGHFIGGEHVDSETTFETRCPFDWDRKLADISRGTAETADLAVTAAVDAFPEWGGYSAAQRAACLNKLVDLIEANADAIAIDRFIAATVAPPVELRT